MKTLQKILLLLLCIVSSKTMAQAPQAIPYQAVVRDNSGSPVVNQIVSVRFTIHDSIPNGTILYRENHNPTSNVYGLISLNIGQGTIIAGVFSSINWGKNKKFLQMELDISGGSNYTDMGTSQMLSVPYALYANRSLFTDSNNFNGILEDKDLMIISTHSHDTVFRVDTNGISKHKGIEFFFRGIWIFDTLTVVDSTGKIVFRINPDGTSFHRGMETFKGGIIVGDSSGSIARIRPDGTIELVDTTGKVVFRINPDGTSFHAGLETFEGGVNVGDSTGSIVRIRPNGTIEVVDTSGKVLFKLNPDGTSFHAGLETFEGGSNFGDSTGSIVRIKPDGTIELVDTSGNVLFRLNPDGTSIHEGLEKYEGGVQVGKPLGTNVHIDPNGSIEVIDGNGKLLFKVDSIGNSFHAGNETFEGDVIMGDSSGSIVKVRKDGTIIITDANGNAVLRINPDGTSYHAGLESFAGGIEVLDSNEAVTFRVKPDGTSYHAGKEYFARGVIVGDTSGVHIEILPDGSIVIYDGNGDPVYAVDSTGSSVHAGVEDFLSGLTSGTTLFGFPAFEILDDGTIIMRDFLGNVVAQFNSDGSSYHAGVEEYKKGIISGNSSGNHSIIHDNGAIELIDSTGTTVFRVNPDGTSFHKGLETFAGGVSVTPPSVITGNGSGINTINAGNISSGTLSDLRLSSNVPLKNAANTFTQAQTINAPGGTALTCTGPLTGSAAQFNGNVSVSGSFIGNAFQSTSLSGKAGQFNGNVAITGNGANGDAALECTNPAAGSLAAHFTGTVNISGDLNISGAVTKGSGTFRIDHPLDPENKYLNHSFVESNDMMNIYNGNIELGEDGKAIVELPNWFESLNMDFRYQLTCIGSFAPVFIEKTIVKNQFTIAGGKQGMVVSWQVTGVRHDPYAEKHRVIVEEDKPENDKGKYLHPEANRLGK